MYVYKLKSPLNMVIAGQNKAAKVLKLELI